MMKCGMLVLWMRRNPGERHVSVDFFLSVDGDLHATLRSQNSRRAASTYNHYRCGLQQDYA